MTSERTTPTHETVVADMAMFPEMNPGPVVRTDEAGVVLLANAAARDLFALSDSVAPRHWSELCPGFSQSLWAEVLSGKDRLQHESMIGDRVFTFTYRRPP